MQELMVGMSETIGRLEQELQQSKRENVESQQTIENLGLALKQKSSSDVITYMKIHANFMKFAQSVQKFSGRGLTIERWFKSVEQAASTVMSGVLVGANPMFVMCILSAFEAGALKWVQSYHEKVGLPDSWVELKEVLWCQFKDTNHVFEQIRRLRDLKCSDELKIGDHCIKFNDLVLSIADPTAILRYFFYRRPMRPWLKCSPKRNSLRGVTPLHSLLLEGGQ